MRRCGKERLIEQIFPAAGKLALGHNMGASHHAAAAETCDEHGIAFLNLGGFAQRHRLELERCDRTQQAEAAFLVIADDIRRHGTPVVGPDFSRVGFDHKITDRQDEAVTVDEDA